MLLLSQATVLGLTHSSLARYMPVFKPCNPLWCLEAGYFPDPCISLVLLMVKVDCWSACRYCILLPKKGAPDNPPPHFPPAHLCLVTQLFPRTHPSCVVPSFQTMFSGTKNNSTALNLQCGTTLKVGVLIYQKNLKIWGDMIDALFF